MDVMCRVRTTDSGKAATNKIKRLLKKRSTQVKPKVNCLKSPSLVDDKTITNTDHKKHSFFVGNKRKSEALECPKVKRSKVDHCQGILTKLMKHKWSCPFLSPVDPDASGDYFQVIKHPMDFGTIKRKLQQNKYIDAEEFEADVRLILANAMLYHPSNDWVHIYATKLNRLFDILWTPVMPKPVRERTIEQNLSWAKNSVITTENPKVKCLEDVPDCSPSRALHVVKLKACFADTIVRAQSKINLQSGNITKVVTSQQEKEKLRQKLEVEVKTAEIASQMKAECKLKKQRQREREAARASREKMERTIDLDDNLRGMRELEALIGSSESGRTKIPLEQLGLYLKPQYRLGDDYDDELFLQDIDLEDGEIFE